MNIWSLTFNTSPRTYYPSFNLQVFMIQKNLIVQILYKTNQRSKILPVIVSEKTIIYLFHRYFFNGAIFLRKSLKASLNIFHNALLQC